MKVAGRHVDKPFRDSAGRRNPVKRDWIALASRLVQDSALPACGRMRTMLGTWPSRP
jgi:hypothetical protein